LFQIPHIGQRPKQVLIYIIYSQTHHSFFVFCRPGLTALLQIYPIPKQLWGILPRAIGAQISSPNPKPCHIHDRHDPQTLKKKTVQHQNSQIINKMNSTKQTNNAKQYGAN
jgi:hypothetical protein